jgi:hypothetical protein
VAKIAAERDLAEPSYSGDLPGLGRRAQDTGYFDKVYAPDMHGGARGPASNYLDSPALPPEHPSGVYHTGLTARVENFARTIGAQIFGKW